MKYIKKFFSIRIIRYGMVGGAGIPINLIAVAIFTLIFGEQPLAGWISLPIVFAFEISTTINFILNQIFTYHDQKLSKHSEWLKRAGKAQITSLSSVLISLGIKYVFHSDNYIASSLGIVFGFLFQFFVTKRFVFRPVAETAAAPHEQLMLSDEAPITSN
jgi:putative flippase GtrA